MDRRLSIPLLSQTVDYLLVMAALDSILFVLRGEFEFLNFALWYVRNGFGYKVLNRRLHARLVLDQVKVKNFQGRNPSHSFGIHLPKRPEALK